MDLIFWFRLLAGAALLFSVVIFARKLQVFNRLARPIEHPSPRGSTAQGLLYAYTIGMAPWSKESTRLHWLSYLRGVAFHMGIFLSLGLLVISPWLESLPELLRLLLAACALFACLFGMIGFASRFVDPNLKSLSTPDDYAAVLVVSLFLGAASIAAAFPAWLPLFYGMAMIMLVYAPFSKIRHCLYFAYARLFFGKAMGMRGVLPHSQQEVSHG